MGCRLHRHIQGHEHAWANITLMHVNAPTCRVCGCSSEACPRFREAASELPRASSEKSVFGFREVASCWFCVGFIAKLCVLVNFREVVGAFRKDIVRSFGAVRLSAHPRVSVAKCDNESESHIATHIAVSLIVERSRVRPTALGHSKGHLCDCIKKRAVCNCVPWFHCCLPSLDPSR